MSETSDTDVRLFLQLANPSVTAVQQSAIEEDDEDAPEYSDDEGDNHGAHTSNENGRDEDDEEEGDEKGDEKGDEGGGEEEDDDEDDDEDEEDEEDEEEDEDDEEGRADDKDNDKRAHSTQLLSTPTEMDPESLEIEKQAALLEIERLKAQGIKITKEYGLQDSLAVIQWEIRKQLLLIDESNSIAFMKDALRLGFSGLETLNQKVQLLELDGWAGEASSELSNPKYSNALSKIYRKYWRRGSSSPEMEICLAIGGSMASYHFRRKMLSSRPPRRPANRMPVVDDSDDDEDAPP